VRRRLDRGDAQLAAPASGATPGIHNAPLYLRLAVPVGGLFALVYFGLNWLTAQRSEHFRLYLDWELSVPFVPGMIYAYASALLLFFLPPFLLSAPRLRALARAAITVLLVAGLCYLLLPATLGFQRPDLVPGYDSVYRALYALALPHNLVPSLHVSCSALCIAALIRASTAKAARLALLIWGLFISVAVLLVHQHHLLDVISGWLLGLAAYRLVYLRGAA
jgi:membrane-associated phospholipid phosphatase